MAFSFNKKTYFLQIPGTFSFKKLSAGSKAVNGYTNVRKYDFPFNIAWICLEDHRERNSIEINYVIREKNGTLSENYRTVFDYYRGRITDYADYDRSFYNFCRKNPDYALNVMDYACDLMLSVINFNSGLSMTRCKALKGIDLLESLVKFPYEPLLNKVVSYSSKVNRLNPDCYNQFCEDLGIKSFRKLRTLYQERPEVLLDYKFLMDCGFTDTNIMLRILRSPVFKRVPAFMEFMKKAIPQRGQLCAWNTASRFDWSSGDCELFDCMRMFTRYSDRLPESFCRQLIKDGPTRYNHDILSKYAWELENVNVEFGYTDFEKSLTDSIEGYDFLLPKDSSMLRNLGAELHNCLSSYKDKVLRKECTVVYVLRDKEYVACIEVRDNTIYQQRVDYNETPFGEMADLLKTWRVKHNLSFNGNHF
ncbi:PcfJ domain-containing protein [Treponema sp.]|uniref:PcfJ domain-containing protein n=1 Tax=Treponema sp. TaxID=166 RepID=UPI0025E36F11|nr:PcfJ domain-containing protein [Treponema sp.]MCR5217993.1 PcfJ domain-containing protein [Treponema sp.]